MSKVYFQICTIKYILVSIDEHYYNACVCVCICQCSCIHAMCLPPSIHPSIHVLVPASVRTPAALSVSACVHLSTCCSVALRQLAAEFLRRADDAHGAGTHTRWHRRTRPTSAHADTQLATRQHGTYNLYAKKILM